MRLKRLLRNSVGVSLLNDRSGLQCVVDNHTLDDNLRNEGWEVESRAVTKQRGFQRRAGEEGEREHGEEDCGTCIATKDQVSAYDG